MHKRSALVHYESEDENSWYVNFYINDKEVNSITGLTWEYAKEMARLFEEGAIDAKGEKNE